MTAPRSPLPSFAGQNTGAECCRPAGLPSRVCLTRQCIRRPAYLERRLSVHGPRRGARTRSFQAPQALRPLVSSQLESGHGATLGAAGRALQASPGSPRCAGTRDAGSVLAAGPGRPGDQRGDSRKCCSGDLVRTGVRPAVLCPIGLSIVSSTVAFKQRPARWSAARPALQSGLHAAHAARRLPLLHWCRLRARP